MRFLLDFIQIYAEGLLRLAPILLALVGSIVTLGLRIGRVEGWDKSDALYFAFITATSVGYGDFAPRRRESKWSAIVIALLGLLLTGLVVSIGLAAVSHAFDEVRRAAAPMTP